MAVYRVMNYEPEGEDVEIGTLETVAGGEVVVDVLGVSGGGKAANLNIALCELREGWGWPGAYLEKMGD